MRNLTCNYVDFPQKSRKSSHTSRGAGRSLPGFGIMLDKKIGSARKVFYLRAGALDVIFSVGFDHELSEIFRFWGCLE